MARQLVVVVEVRVVGVRAVGVRVFRVRRPPDHGHPAPPAIAGSITTSSRSPTAAASSPV